ncbi:MAG: hypothetical protein ABEN55_15575, partial [Bradymonadaceae bacterium]
DKRTEPFPTLRPLVRLEQGRVAALQGEAEASLRHLEQALDQAIANGHYRFQAEIFGLHAQVLEERSPEQALLEARHAEFLFKAIGKHTAMARVRARIESLQDAKDTSASSDDVRSASKERLSKSGE